MQAPHAAGVLGSLTEFWMSREWRGIPRIKDKVKRKVEAAKRCGEAVGSKAITPCNSYFIYLPKVSFLHSA